MLEVRGLTNKAAMIYLSRGVGRIQLMFSLALDHSMMFVHTYQPVTFYE